MSTYYPLKPGNSWTYKNNDGSTFTNAVEAEENGVFTMTNTLAANKTHVKIEGDTYFADSYEAGNMQPFLKENAAAGDTWEIKYKANTIDSVLTVVIKGVGGTKEVEGKTYNDVMEMEGSMSFIVNGSVFPAGTKYSWFYAKGTGLILTSSTLGDHMPLVSCNL
ncbi:MAG: hypothetical protein U0X40_06120 [Ferruginibacter sp.]